MPIRPAKFYITRQFTWIPLVYGWSKPHQEHSKPKGLDVISARPLWCLEGDIYPALITHHVRKVPTSSILLYKGVKMLSYSHLFFSKVLVKKDASYQFVDLKCTLLVFSIQMG